MKKRLNAFLSLILLPALAAVPAQAKTKPSADRQQLSFIENKGQLRDQDGRTRNDIQFSLQSGGVSVFVGAGQMHYQFLHLELPENGLPKSRNTSMPDTSGADMHACVSTYRMDVQLVGANLKAPAVTAEPQAYYENYYLPGCPAEGLHAHTYRQITYKDVYPGIDWKLYTNGRALEHEFIVAPGADASVIKLKYEGQTSLKINDDGSITATTPMGTVHEHAPICYTPGGAKIAAAYHLHNNELTYDVTGYKNGLVIDPSLEWATYYGPDSTTTEFYGLACDDSANVFGAGLTWSTLDIATSGAYQTVNTGGETDAFIVKFDSSGVRQWATYYGGSNGDYATAITSSATHDLYVTGIVESTTGIATAGCQQGTYGGGTWDCFLLKLTSGGFRDWATYLGGTGADAGDAVVCDAAGMVYVAGYSQSSTNIGTSGTFQPSRAGGFDCFLVQYNSDGVRQWGTYYGGTGSEYNSMVCTDGINIYLGGWTPSTSGIATALSHQPHYGGGGSDAFMAKFNNAGYRFWGTYIGGNQSETIGGMACDSTGYIYMLGGTSSDTGIASAGCFQPARGGGVDAFLVKIEPENGDRVWGTYYGGPGDETQDFSRIVTDGGNNVYIVGYTTSTTGIASALGSIQSVNGGGSSDGYFAKFGPSGFEHWSTFYGGSGLDQGRGMAYDGKCVYTCGYTTSTDSIATPGSFLPTGGGAEFYYQGFLAKYDVSDTFGVLAVPVYRQQQHVDIYPVPNNGTFSLSGSLTGSDGTALLAITDVAGRQIMTEQATVTNGRIYEQVTLPAATPAGTYYLKIVLRDNVSVLPFVKK